MEERFVGGPPPGLRLAGVRDVYELAISPRSGAMIGEGPQFGPQAAPDRQPPTLIKARADIRRSLRYRGESLRGSRTLPRPVDGDQSSAFLLCTEV